LLVLFRRTYNNADLNSTQEQKIFVLKNAKNPVEYIPKDSYGTSLGKSKDKHNDLCFDPVLWIEAFENCKKVI
jgi:hypothetical protein